VHAAGQDEALLVPLGQAEEPVANIHEAIQIAGQIAPNLHQQVKIVVALDARGQTAQAGQEVAHFPHQFNLG
jgi:hypothetical protein